MWLLDRATFSLTLVQWRVASACGLLKKALPGSRWRKLGGVDKLFKGSAAIKLVLNVSWFVLLWLLHDPRVGESCVCTFSNRSLEPIVIQTIWELRAVGHNNRLLHRSANRLMAIADQAITDQFPHSSSRNRWDAHMHGKYAWEVLVGEFLLSEEA